MYTHVLHITFKKKADPLTKSYREHQLCCLVVVFCFHGSSFSWKRDTKLMLGVMRTSDSYNCSSCCINNLYRRDIQYIRERRCFKSYSSQFSQVANLISASDQGKQVFFPWSKEEGLIGTWELVKIKHCCLGNWVIMIHTPSKFSSAIHSINQPWRKYIYVWL